MLSAMMTVTETDQSPSVTKLALFVLWLLLFVFSPAHADRSAFDYLNEVRKQAGMTLLKNDRELARASQNHADYLAYNLRGDVTRMSSAHDESPGRAGFTGRTPQERALSAGYPHDYRAGANVNFRREKINYFLNYGASYRERPGSGSAKRKSTSTARKPRRVAFFAWATKRADLISAFDGTQPVFRQSPPILCRSTSATLALTAAAI